MSSRVIWCDKGFYPVHIGFCSGLAAWDRLMRRVNLKDRPYPARLRNAATTAFDDPNGNLRVIVTIGDIPDPVDVVCALVHEAVHVWQHIRLHIGEKEPGWEPEAYAIQQISRELILAYSKTRMPQP